MDKLKTCAAWVVDAARITLVMCIVGLRSAWHRLRGENDPS